MASPRYIAEHLIMPGFLRLHQSEAVLLQFGDLVAPRGERIEARWPVLAAGA